MTSVLRNKEYELEIHKVLATDVIFKMYRSLTKEQKEMFFNPKNRMDSISQAHKMFTKASGIETRFLGAAYEALALIDDSAA